MESPFLKWFTIGVMSIILLLFVGLGLVFWGKSPRKDFVERYSRSACLSEPEDYVVPDNSMEGVLYKGFSYPSFTNWQNCVRLQKGDIVLYRYAARGTPVARSVAAVPGDKIELIRNTEKNNWNIKINGFYYMPNPNGEPYGFGSGADHPISLYANAHDGVLDSKAYIIFAAKPTGGRDSGEFGVVSENDLVGIVANYPNDRAN